MRDLSRARLAAHKDLKGKRQQISSLMLRLGRIYPGKKTWGPAWALTMKVRQKLGHGEQRQGTGSSAGHHQSRQWSGATHPGRGSLGISACSRGPSETGKGGSRAEACPRDRVEGPDAIVQALPIA